MDLHRTPPLYRNTPPYLHSTPPPYLTPPYRSTSTETARDSRIPQTSVFDRERLRNPLVNQNPGRNRDEVFHREHRIATTSLETRIDRAEEMMFQLAKSALDLVEQMKAMTYRLPPQDHPKSVLHQVNSKTSTLASPLFKQLETESIESSTPAPIVQDPVHRFVSTSHMEQVIPEMVPLHCQEQKPATLHLMAKTSPTQQPGNCNLSSFAINMLSNAVFQEFCSKFGVNPLILSNWKQAQPVAHQVFVEMTQPIIQAVDDESDGTNSQEKEATSKELPESTPKFNHPVLKIHEVNIQKVSEFGVKFFDDEIKLKTNLCVMKNVRDHIMVFPVVDSEEASYFVEDDCELKTVNVSMIVLPCSQEIRMDVVEMERIGVG